MIYRRLIALVVRAGHVNPCCLILRRLTALLNVWWHLALPCRLPDVAGSCKAALSPQEWRCNKPASSHRSLIVHQLILLCYACYLSGRSCYRRLGFHDQCLVSGDQCERCMGPTLSWNPTSVQLFKTDRCLVECNCCKSQACSTRGLIAAGQAVLHKYRLITQVLQRR